MKHLMQFKRLDTNEVISIASKIDGDTKHISLETHKWENGELSFVQVPIQVIQHEEHEMPRPQ